MSGKVLKGNVIPSRMSKTLKVKVGFSKKHPRYNKRYIIHNTFKVHCDDVSKYKEGDIVEIVECPPISKSKNWIFFKKADKFNLNVKEKKKKKVKIVKEKK